MYHIPNELKPERIEQLKQAGAQVEKLPYENLYTISMIFESDAYKLYETLVINKRKTKKNPNILFWFNSGGQVLTEYYKNNAYSLWTELTKDILKENHCKQYQKHPVDIINALKNLNKNKYMDSNNYIATMFHNWGDCVITIDIFK